MNRPNRGADGGCATGGSSTIDSASHALFTRQVALDEDQCDQEHATDHLLVVRAERSDLVDQIVDHVQQQNSGERPRERAEAG